MKRVWGSCNLLLCRKYGLVLARKGCDSFRIGPGFDET